MRWEEEGRYLDVIVELMSPSTAKVERTFRTADYFAYNPFDAVSLQGWHLHVTQRYQLLGLASVVD